MPILPAASARSTGLHPASSTSTTWSSGRRSHRAMLPCLEFRGLQRALRLRSDAVRRQLAAATWTSGGRTRVPGGESVTSGTRRGLLVNGSARRILGGQAVNGLRTEDTTCPATVESRTSMPAWAGPPRRYAASWLVPGRRNCADAAPNCPGGHPSPRRWQKSPVAAPKRPSSAHYMHGELRCTGTSKLSASTFARPPRTSRLR
jgi:hypothetical protein